MARPTFNDITSALEAWDAELQLNIDVFKDAPWPVFEHTGDESDLQSTFAAAAYDRCMVMVNHTTLGWCVYFSDGSAWRRVVRLTATGITQLADSTGGTANNALVAISGTGDDASVNNNFADLAAKVEEIRQVLIDQGEAT